MRSDTALSIAHQVGMPDAELQFESQKAHRGWYFVEYHPPRTGDWFAVIQLVLLERSDDELIALAMESEARTWQERYPVSVMVTAFDADDGLHDLGTARPSSILRGHVEFGAGTPRLVWDESQDAEMVPRDLDDETLLSIYADVPVDRTTDKEREALFREHLRTVKLGRRLVLTWLLVWLAAIPVTVAVFEFLGPSWLGAAALAYCVFKALIQVARLLGLLQPSAHARAERQKVERMEHYYEHCEKNPAGFARLMAENLDQEARERTRAEAEALLGESKEPA